MENLSRKFIVMNFSHRLRKNIINDASIDVHKVKWNKSKPKLLMNVNNGASYKMEINRMSIKTKDRATNAGTIQYSQARR